MRPGVDISTLFTQSHNKMLRYAGKLIPDYDNRKEIVQLVFVKFWEKRVTNLSEGYLKIAVKNACINFLIKERTDSWKNQPLSDKLSIDNTEEIITQVVYHIQDEIELFPPQRKKIFQMWTEGSKPKRIAEELGLSIQTVKNEKCQALKILKSKFPNLNLCDL